MSQATGQHQSPYLSFRLQENLGIMLKLTADFITLAPSTLILNDSSVWQSSLNQILLF